MHETSLVMGMLESVTKVAKKENAKEITKVRVEIGKLSGVVLDSFVFAFDALKKEFPYTSGTELEIVEIPSKYICIDCEKEFSAETLYFPECPDCGSLNVKMISGDELKVIDIEIDV